MALSANTVWEVRDTGSDTNGGGWVAGSTGTDWSQQDAAQYSVTDAVTNGTTTITSASANFGTDVVGNILYIQGGTGSITAGWYQIATRTNSTTITVDRSTGLTTGTGATLKIGGALLTLATLNSVMIASNKAYVKGTGFTSTAGISFAQNATPNGATAATRLIGYTTTRGDKGRFLLTLQTNSALTGLKATGGGFYFENCSVDCASLTTSIGIDSAGQYQRVINCKVSNFTSMGIKAQSGSSVEIYGNEVTGGTSAASAGINANTIGFIFGNWVHDNSCPGIISTSTSGVLISNNLVTNNTGASSDGIQHGYRHHVLYNTCHANGRDGIRNTTQYSIEVCVRNNLLTSNGAYGCTGSSSTANPADEWIDGNAYWNNTSGTRNLMDNVTGIYAVNGYTNVFDKTLTGDPYTAKASNDFTLNNTSGAGASCRGSAVPSTLGGLSTTSTAGDMGCSQAVAAAAVVGGSYVFVG